MMDQKKNFNGELFFKLCKEYGVQFTKEYNEPII